MNNFQADQMGTLRLENAKLHRDLYKMAELMRVPVEVDDQLGDTWILGKKMY